jgi:hypothetical protein
MEAAAETVMAYVTNALLPTLGMLAGMLGCIEAGRRLGIRRRAGAAESRDVSAPAIDGAIFALFGLLIAFTFSGAMGRFDHRRDQIAEEANAIGTAWLRIDLLPADAQLQIRQLFREYVRSRIATYQDMSDVKTALAEYDRTQALQGEIWGRAVPSARSTGDVAVLRLVVQSLNDMFDITTSRLHASRTHVPVPILALLFGLALVSALVVGYESAEDQQSSSFRRSMFALVISVCIFVILDLEQPRIGVIRIDEADRLLEELLAQMK